MATQETAASIGREVQDGVNSALREVLKGGRQYGASVAGGASRAKIGIEESRSAVAPALSFSGGKIDGQKPKQRNSNTNVTPSMAT